MKATTSLLQLKPPLQYDQSFPSTIHLKSLEKVDIEGLGTDVVDIAEVSPVHSPTPNAIQKPTTSARETP